MSFIKFLAANKVIALLLSVAAISVVGGSVYMVVSNSNKADYNYSITVTQPITGGTITAPSSAHAGDTVSLSFNAESGYSLDSWDVKDSSNSQITVSNNMFTMPSANVNVTATAKHDTYSITVTQPEEGGTISAPANAHYGDTVNISFNAETGYELDSWQVTDSSGDSVSVSDNTFKMPDNDVTVSAVVTKTETEETTNSNATEKTYSVSITVADGFESITADKNAVVAGDTVHLSYVLKPGYSFESWAIQDSFGNGIGVSDNAFVMPSNDVTVTASAIRDVYSVTINQPSTGGTITATPTTGYYGDKVKLSFDASVGYKLGSWVVKDASGNRVRVSNNEFAMPSSNATVSCVVAKVDYKINLTQSEGGTISAPATAHMGDSVKLSFNASPGYTFNAWTVKDSKGSTVAVENDVFTMPADSVTVSASVIEYFSFTVDTSNTLGIFYLPTSGFNGIVTTNKWNIDWGDGSDIQEETVTSSFKADGVLHVYAEPNEQHTITINATSSDAKAWMTAFGFDYFSEGANTQTNRDCVVGINSPLLWEMTRETPEGNYDETSQTYVAPDYEYAYMFAYCTKLVDLNSSFNLPQNVTTMGNYYCDSLFARCSSLTKVPDGFTLPSFTGITSIADHYCANLFANCNLLTDLPKNFTLPNFESVTTIGSSFCANMFSNCKALVSLPNSFALPKFEKVTTIDANFLSSMFYFSNKLTSLPSGFVLPSFDSIYTVGSSFCYALCYGCSSLESMPKGFYIPQFKNMRITGLGSSFCGSMFNSCTSLVINDDFTLPYFETYNNIYKSMFKNCKHKQTALIENIIKPWTDAGTDPSKGRNTFTNDTGFDDYSDMKTAHPNWF